MSVPISNGKLATGTWQGIVRHSFQLLPRLLSLAPFYSANIVHHSNNISRTLSILTPNVLVVSGVPEYEAEKEGLGYHTRGEDVGALRLEIRKKQNKDRVKGSDIVVTCLMGSLISQDSIETVVIS